MLKNFGRDDPLISVFRVLPEPPARQASKQPVFHFFLCSTRRRGRRNFSDNRWSLLPAGFVGPSSTLSVAVFLSNGGMDRFFVQQPDETRCCACFRLRPKKKKKMKKNSNARKKGIGSNSWGTMDYYCNGDKPTPITPIRWAIALVF